MDLRTSEELADEIVKKLKDEVWHWISPTTITKLIVVNRKERTKMKQVIELLVFRKALKFNTDRLLWENMYYEK